MVNPWVWLKPREVNPFEIFRMQGGQVRCGHGAVPFMRYGWLTRGSHRASAMSVASRTGGVMASPTFMYCPHVTR